MKKRKFIYNSGILAEVNKQLLKVSLQYSNKEGLLQYLMTIPQYYGTSLFNIQ